MKPRILVIENSIAITGALNSIVRSAVSLKERFDFVFAIPPGSVVRKQVEQNGFRVIELPMKEIRKSLPSLLLYLPFLLYNLSQLRRILRQEGIHLMVNNDFYNLLPPFYRWTGGKTPYVTYVRFIPGRFPVWLTRTWLFLHHRWAQQILAVSERVKKDLHAVQRVSVVYDAVPAGFPFCPMDPESKTILYLSNCIPGKGLDYAIRAFATMRNVFPDWHLRFVGGDMGLKKNKKYRDSLKALAITLNLADRVEWVETAENTMDEYRKAALVLNYSDSESFSLTCFEALAVGRAVIATRSGGPEEMITPGLTGELVEVGNLGEMITAMRKLMADKALRKVYGEHAHQGVSEKFSFDRTTAQLEIILYQAIKTYF